MVEDFGLNELINHYDREDIRKQDLESKASYILGVVSLIITILLTVIIEKSKIMIILLYLIF